jgi:glycosyltransferase involved in cell wall biosynthesis
MANRPFFSVLMPTKNRSEILGGAIESVLGQSFPDFEIILSDNDDSPTATAEVAARYADPRLRYFRTSGRLPMHENWENAFLQAQGQQVLLLEDKMRLVPNALEILHRCLEQHGPLPISYRIKFAKRDRLPGPRTFPKVQRLDSKETIESFCRFEQDFFQQLPKALDSCASRELLERVKTGSPSGLLFSYISPDYASGFMLLAATPAFLHITTPLVYVPHNWMWRSQYSNGQASYRKTDSYRRFLASLPVTREEILEHVPIKSEFLWINSVLYDFFALYRRPDHQPRIDWVSYHAFCLVLLLLGKKAGGELSFEFREIRRSLRQQGLGFASRVLLDLGRRLGAIAWRRCRAKAG